MYAYARKSDPITSWLAAHDITDADINRNKAAVLGFLLARGSAIQQDAEEWLERYENMTPQRTRTTFSDLEHMGLINKTGETRPTRRGRKAAVYALTAHKDQGGLF